MRCSATNPPLIAKKRDLKQAAMQQLLTGQTRLTGFGGIEQRYKQTEVGVIPKEWEIKKVGDVCTLINGRGFKPHEWEASGLPIIRIQNLNGSEEFNHYTGGYDPKILVEPGQLLFCVVGEQRNVVWTPCLERRAGLTELPHLEGGS